MSFCNHLHPENILIPSSEDQNEWRLNTCKLCKHAKYEFDYSHPGWIQDLLMGEGGLTQLELHVPPSRSVWDGVVVWNTAEHLLMR